MDTIRIYLLKKTDFCSGSKSAKKLEAKLQELLVVCRENLYYAHKIWKQAYNKSVKPMSYASDDKILLNNK